MKILRSVSVSFQRCAGIWHDMKTERERDNSNLEFLLSPLCREFLAASDPASVERPREEVRKKSISYHSNTPPPRNTTYLRGSERLSSFIVLFSKLFLGIINTWRKKNQNLDFFSFFFPPLRTKKTTTAERTVWQNNRRRDYSMDKVWRIKSY